MPLLPASIARAAARTFSRRQCNAVDAVVAPSRQLAEVLERYGVTSPIRTIPTGLNLDVPNVLLVIAGEGPAVAGLRRAAADAGLASNLLFVGYLDRRGPLLDCYRAAGLFVFASRTETQGLVLLESLALGVPVVSTAVLGTKEVLANAAGAIVVEEDVAEFAAAVTRVLTEPCYARS